MFAKKLVFVLLLTFGAFASAEPGRNVPISDAEWEALTEAGLKRRADINKPISDVEYAALEAGGLTTKGVNELEARDHVMNCGHRVTGKGGSNGHGKWVPVAQFKTLARSFCDAYVGTDIAKGHETSDTYGVTLSNGKDGNVVFAIYNTQYSDAWILNSDTCYNAMIAPLGNHAKRDVSLGKRDNCWGSKHNDYEGGYYKVDKIGAFGSEVYASK
ncbi:hypothetical protein IFM61606_06423 [Aspergillus udagawae]|uniref:Uncharacterized protein n=1 Tax=Aspergillus udagawae TaxID=91492 RepID=A0ABQ1AT62_9EURO|nr:hypothetical protein IFM51744_07856 [Aspergillus udagawae]GFF87584.1 hypothetical protein IFM53868_05196 [Aspergillus udagawae]GFG12501.1 hypothetical protein IFM5058_05979 [Aspergillus udagawae]GFG26441.1 hypothetical protein IFM61606_06423 [Aspergillus udagawae]